MRDVAAIRAIVPDPDAQGLRAYVTGEAAFAADQSAAFEGIDETLLAVTLVLVLVLLLAIYRSPVLALVPLLVVGIAYLVAAALVYALANAGAFRATGQATAILIVLMFGARTDYCLLLLARYREELTDDPQAAMTTALRSTGPAIVSAGGIVVVVMLTLGVASYNATRWMGPVLAIGTAITVLAGITLLPALLVSFGVRARRSAESDAVAADRRVRQGPSRGARRRRARSADRGRARQPARQRHARLRRAVPHAARVGRGAAADAGEVHARARPARSTW